MADYPDFEGQKSGIYSIADWAAHEGKEKFFEVTDSPVLPWNAMVLDYAVPAGKKLYILGGSWGTFAAAVANYDHFLWIWVNIYDLTTGNKNVMQVSLGGGNIVLKVPAIIPANHTLRLFAQNMSNVGVWLAMNAWGYEL